MKSGSLALIFGHFIEMKVEKAPSGKLLGSEMSEQLVSSANSRVTAVKINFSQSVYRCLTVLNNNKSFTATFFSIN